MSLSTLRIILHKRRNLRTEIICRHARIIVKTVAHIIDFKTHRGVSPLPCGNPVCQPREVVACALLCQRGTHDVGRNILRPKRGNVIRREHIVEIMFLNLICRIPSCVIGLEGDDILRLRADSHRIERTIVEKRLHTGGSLRHSNPSASGIFFQLEVDTGLLREFNPFKSLYGLMVFHHLYRCHILVGYVIGGKAVLAADKIVAVEIELVDWLSLIFYRSVIFDLDARQAFDNVDNGIVFGIGILSHVEYKRVAFCIYVGSLNYHVVKTSVFLIKTDTGEVGGDGQREGFVAHEAK